MTNDAHVGNTSPIFGTLLEYIGHWAEGSPDQVWLRDRKGDAYTEWTWSRARAEIHAVGAWIEERFGNRVNAAILSRNRAHWYLADYAIIGSGNVTIPIFTTLPGPTAEYVLDFSETRLLFVGETENWEAVRNVLPEGITIVSLPGYEVEEAKFRWDDILADAAGSTLGYRAQPDDLVSLVFTSGTTGVPKGVMQTHESNIIPIARFESAFQVRDNPKFLSYLPLSHIAERQLVEGHSLLRKGTVTFNESLPTLIRDLQAVHPSFFFGPPRVWEQLQQIVTSQFGSPEAVDAAVAEDAVGTGRRVVELLGLGECDYCLTAAAPTPPALIEWFGRFGVEVLEGFGQTEAMGLVANSRKVRRIGSIGKPMPDVQIRLSSQDELLVKADGLSPGYYKMPEKTAELLQKGWVHTGDKARIDDDGFIFLTGRVKDYFKTIHGKFVAPAPIEGAFADNDHSEQLCLLGRGYSKTVVVCVLSALAQEQPRDVIETALRSQAEAVNKGVDKHERIGAVMITSDPWTIANEVLTPTLKIRRERVEDRFGKRAQELALAAAEQGKILVEWA